jgi:hypothetical protein
MVCDEKNALLAEDNCLTLGASFTTLAALFNTQIDVVMSPKVVLPLLLLFSFLSQFSDLPVILSQVPGFGGLDFTSIIDLLSLPGGQSMIL